MRVNRKSCGKCAIRVSDHAASLSTSRCGVFSFTRRIAFSASRTLCKRAFARVADRKHSCRELSRRRGTFSSVCVRIIFILARSRRDASIVQLGKSFQALRPGCCGTAPSTRYRPDVTASGCLRPILRRYCGIRLYCYTTRVISWKILCHCYNCVPQQQQSISGTLLFSEK